jgi:competence protein ComEA
MSGFRWLVDQYLQLPKWERIANIVLFSLILSAILFISFWPAGELSEKEKADLDKKEAEILAQQKNVNDSAAPRIPSAQPKKNFKLIPVFISDISKASVEDLEHAGLSKKVAKGMFNYIQKGGKIKSEKDVRKIYGMTVEMASTFLKNVNLGQPIDTITKSNNKSTFGPREKTLVNLNTADSASLVFIDGISPKMIPFILKFRRSIGAFYSPEQLNEVFKSPMKNFEHIKEQVTVEGFKPFIKINSITTEELRKYTYFKKDNLASVLVAYREKHGKFTKKEDLKKCAVVTDEVLYKIEPYLVFD